MYLASVDLPFRQVLVFPKRVTNTLRGCVIVEHVSMQGGDIAEQATLRRRHSTRLGGWLVGFVLVGLLLFAAPASATFHLMRVREVYPAGSASFVELQMLAVGEYQVGGHHLVSYNANGTVANDFTMPNDVSANSRNNSTILITGPGYAAAFPGGPSADELNPSLNLSPAGGALCWVEGEPPDCVAWGNFTGPMPSHIPPLVVGNPASPTGVTAGKALRRTIGARLSDAPGGDRRQRRQRHGLQRADAKPP